MHKYTQVHTKNPTRLIVPDAGSHSWTFSVPEGVRLSLVILGLTSFEAGVTVRLTGTGSAATITGVLVGNGNMKQILHTSQVHEAPGTTSDLLVKSVLSGRARCLYDGGIFVGKDAQKTDAYQRNENLLLSGRAYAESKPSLEILANDVRCTHGSTTGPVDAEALWYMAARGIPKEAGEHLLVDGFVGGALLRIKNTRLLDTVQKQLTDAV